MEPTAAPTIRATSPRRRRLTVGRLIVYPLLLLLCAAVGAFVYFTSPARVAAMASDALHRATGAVVSVQSATFDINGTIRLFNVDLRVPGIPGNPRDGDRLFTADEVLIDHHPMAMLGGGLDIESISLIRPTFYPTEHVEDGKFTFQLLKQPRQPKKETKDRRSAFSLRELRLSQARIVRGEIQAGVYRELQSVVLSGELTREEGEAAPFLFDLRQQAGEQPLVLSGSFTPAQETLIAKLQLDRFTSNDPRLAMLPRRLRATLDQLKPTGQFSAITFGYDPTRRFHASVELQDGAVTIPWGQTELQVVNTRGPISIEQNNRLTVDLKGEARGSNYGGKYEVKGVVDGFGDDAAFDLQMKLASHLPERPQDVHLLPGLLRFWIDRYGIKGQFFVDVNVQRDPASGEILTHGTVDLIDASITYAFFKYPLEQAKGRLVFDDEQVIIQSITGVGPADAKGRRAKIVVNGEVIGTGKYPGVHIRAKAVDAPIDDSLRAALQEGQRDLVDLFQDPQQFRRLSDDAAGVIQTAAQRDARQKELARLAARRRELETANPIDPDALIANQTAIDRVNAQLSRPVFEPGGLANVVIDAVSLPGHKEPTIVVEAELAGFNVLYRQWPYPLTIDSGKLTLTLPSHVKVQGLKAHGLSGGTLTLEGELRPDPTNHRRVVPDLILTAADAPIDDLLLATVHETQAKWLRDLQVKGKLQAQGTIGSDEQQRLDLHVNVALDGGTARPHGGELLLTDFNSRLAVRRDGVDIESVEAKRGEGSLRVSRRKATDQAAAQLVLEGAKLRFEDHLWDLIPPGEQARVTMRQLAEKFVPSGEFDFTLVSNTGATTPAKSRPAGPLEAALPAAALPAAAGGEPFDYRLELLPRSLNFTLGKTPVNLTGVSGRVVVTPKLIELEKLKAGFACGRVAISGFLQQSGGGYDLIIDAEAEKICEIARTLLPQGAVAAIDGLQLEGAYKMQGARLTHTPVARVGDGPGSPVADTGSKPGTLDAAGLRFDGVIKLANAKAVVAGPVTELYGDLKLSVAARPDAPVTVDLKLDQASMRTVDRLIEPFSVRVSNTKKPGLYEISDFKGLMYGGMVMGKGSTWRQDDKTRFKIDSLTLQEVELEPFLSPLDPKFKRVEGAPGLRVLSDKGIFILNPRPADDLVKRERTGLLSASLSIEGAVEDPRSRTGRGDLRIRDASLYETPLGLAVLQILNLAAPVHRSFRSVEAGYLIDGDTVHLESIVFAAPTLTIAGKGNMKYSTLEIDLDMTTANPKLDLGPVTDILKMLRDELVSIKVTGTLTKPKTELRTLKGVGGAVGDLIGKPKEPKSRPIKPE